MDLQDKSSFFSLFLDAEFQCSLSRWNKNVTNEEHKIQYLKYTSFFHSHASSGGKYSRSVGFLDDYTEQELTKKYSEIRKRILYMVRVYKEYELGENWSDLVEEGTLLYRFYVSSDTAYEGKELTYISESFFAADTDEGFKIIGTVGYRKKQWRHMTVSYYQIGPLGKADQILRLQEPEDEDSKRIYFSDEEQEITEYPR